MLLYQLQGPFAPQGGNAFSVPAPVSLPSPPPNGHVFLFEDDRQIGQGESAHVDIRGTGGGLFSVWFGSVYLSTSDNSDPNENGRRYSLIATDLSIEGDLGRVMQRNLAFDELTMMRLVIENAGINNSIFSNFFSYRDTIMEPLRRNGIALPNSILEVGCGERPYTGLRFVAERAKRYIANDIGPVRTRFDAHLAETLLNCVRIFDARLANGLAGRLQREEKGYTASGLTGIGERACETIDVGEQVSFITSTSVLEHVNKPAEVVAAFDRFLAPGGTMWHSIDLRDHRDFSLPLAFLSLTEDGYREKTENRLRASDWSRLFATAGFEEIETNRLILLPDGNQVWTMGPPPPVAGVSAELRAAFAPPFDSREFVDLSTLAVQSLYRKPT